MLECVFCAFFYFLSCFFLPCICRVHNHGAHLTCGVQQLLWVQNVEPYTFLRIKRLLGVNIKVMTKHSAVMVRDELCQWWNPMKNKRKNTPWVLVIFILWECQSVKQLHYGDSHHHWNWVPITQVDLKVQTIKDFKVLQTKWLPFPAEKFSTSRWRIITKHFVFTV